MSAKQFEIRTLEGAPHEDIRETFNESFADYFVKISLTPEQLEWKIIAEKIHLPYSTGIFSDGKLGGIILHAVDKVDGKKVVYNAGTGVIPEFRGNALTKKMYEYILPLLKKETVDYLVLEVLVQNIQAIKSYEAVGYYKDRRLISFKGEMAMYDIAGITIREITLPDLSGLTSWWNYIPSWQNSNHILVDAGDSIRVFGAFRGDVMTGYVIHNPVLKRVHQLAVHPQHRRQRIGRALLRHVQTHFGAPLVLLNIDAVSGDSISFLESIGLDRFIEQHEMKMELR